MSTRKPSFGEVVSERRKANKWSLRELVAKVRKEDGDNITPQYLNDIEHGRRIPSGFVIGEIAKAIELPEDYLRSLAGSQPRDVQAYLKKSPDMGPEVAKVFRKAKKFEFTDWESIVEKIESKGKKPSR